MKITTNQDITYFDTHDVGELNTRMFDDIKKVNDSIGEKAGLVTQIWVEISHEEDFSLLLLCKKYFLIFWKNLDSFKSIGMTVGGFIVGFWYGWKLALVCIAIAPALGVSGYLFFKVRENLIKVN